MYSATTEAEIQKLRGGGKNSLRALLSLSDARVYWLLVLAFVCYCVLGTPNTPEFLLPIGGALVAGGFAMAAAGYRWDSFVVIFVIAHVVAFPIGAWIILSLATTSPWIEPDIWATTPLGMWAMVVGMIGLALGTIIGRLRVVGSPKNEHPNSAQLLTPRTFNLALTSLVVPVVMIYLSLGIYYHKDAVGIDQYDFGNASEFGFIGYLMMLSYVGTVLQLRRFMLTRLSADRWAAIAAIVIPFVAMLPSGSRATTFLGPTIAGIAFLAWESKARVRWVVLLGGAVAFLFLVPIMETYRLAAQNEGGLSFVGRVELAVEFARWNRDGAEDPVPDLARGMLGRRLSDHHSVGYIIDVVPSAFPFRGSAGMTQFPLYLVPTLLRPQTTLNYNYDADIMQDYGFRTDIGGSSPMMLIGELYDRFAWAGILIGMVVIGFALARLDRFIALGTVRSTILWVFFLQGIINIHTYSLLKIFTLATRQTAIFVVLALLVERMARAWPEFRVSGLESALT
jgi:hypothetical protein